jgi:hypothetical protein
MLCFPGDLANLFAHPLLPFPLRFTYVWPVAVRPSWPINCRARGNRDTSPTSATIVTAVTWATPAGVARPRSRRASSAVSTSPLLRSPDPAVRYALRRVPPIQVIKQGGFFLNVRGAKEAPPTYICSGFAPGDGAGRPPESNAAIPPGAAPPSFAYAKVPRILFKKPG